MKNAQEISEDAFEKLLKWLNPDRELAALKYEAIRLRLVKIFQYRGSNSPQELADITFDRVYKKVHSLVKNYEGDPALYFFGVANNVFHESLKRPQIEELPPEIVQPEAEVNETEKELDCLDECLNKLPEEQRGFIIGYYQDDKQAKIDNRKKLAETEGIGGLAGRVRAYRLRMKLQKCIVDCVGKKCDETF